MTDQPLAAPAPILRLPGALGELGGRLTPANLALLIIAVFVALRLILAAVVGLGTDESYSVAVARDLHASYFDHPPMHYWLAHAMEPLAGVGRGERLPFIALFAGSSWLMFVLTRRLFGAAAGVWAVLALNLSGFFTLAAGGWVLPDGPLIFALLAAATVLAESWFAAPVEARPARPLLAWLLAGLCLGLAGLSKYQAALFCVGLGAFLITTPRGRRQLASPGPYLAALVTLVVLAPVLVWNATHGWASIAFQAGRGAPRHLRLDGPLTALAGQAGVLLPWVFVPMVIAAFAAGRRGPADERRWLCLMLGAPSILIFTLSPLMGPNSLPHWSMPGWLFLFPLLGALLASAARSRAWPRIWAACSALFLIGIGAAAAQEAATGWLGPHYPKLFRHGDPTAESIEWTQLRGAVSQSPLLREPGSFIAALKWNEAGKIDQAVGDLAPVTVLSSDPRQFAYRHAAAGYLGHDALIIGRLETVQGRLAELRPYFRSVRMVSTLRLGREGRGEVTLGLAEARDLVRPYPSPAVGR